MIKILYSIEVVPNKVLGPHDVFSLTEGHLEILGNTVNEKIVFEESILLVEFAVVLTSWLTCFEKNTSCDMYYASQDFEEEPVLHFQCDENSVLISSSLSQSFLKAQKEELTEAVHSYIKSLTRDLAKLGLNILPDLKEASRTTDRHLSPKQRAKQYRKKIIDT